MLVMLSPDADRPELDELTAADWRRLVVTAPFDDLVLPGVPGGGLLEDCLRALVRFGGGASRGPVQLSPMASIRALHPRAVFDFIGTSIGSVKCLAEVYGLTDREQIELWLRIDGLQSFQTLDLDLGAWRAPHGPLPLRARLRRLWRRLRYAMRHPLAVLPVVGDGLYSLDPLRALLREAIGDRKPMARGWVGIWHPGQMRHHLHALHEVPLEVALTLVALSCTEPGVHNTGWIGREVGEDGGAWDVLPVKCPPGMQASDYGAIHNVACAPLNLWGRRVHTPAGRLRSAVSRVHHLLDPTLLARSACLTRRDLEAEARAARTTLHLLYQPTHVNEVAPPFRADNRTIRYRAFVLGPKMVRTVEVIDGTPAELEEPPRGGLPGMHHPG